MVCKKSSCKTRFIPVNTYPEQLEKAISTYKSFSVYSFTTRLKIIEKDHKILSEVNLYLLKTYDNNFLQLGITVHLTGQIILIHNQKQLNFLKSQENRQYQHL